MTAPSPRARAGRRTTRDAIASLDVVLLTALRALLTRHPSLEDPGRITGDGRAILTVAERVVDRIMDLRDLLEHYQSAVRERSRPRALPNDDDILF